MLSKGERQAISKANKLGGAAKVERVAYGIYLVPSASTEAVYTVTGHRIDGADFRCSCPAGEAGRPCWHKAAVRLRKVQEAAKGWARKRAQCQHQHEPAAIAAAPAPLPRASTVTLRVGGVAYVGTGTHRLEALANATRAA